MAADTGHHSPLNWHQMPECDHTAADYVIGQPEFASVGRNGKGSPRAVTLNVLTGLAHSAGALVIADSGNNRVLIWELAS